MRSMLAMPKLGDAVAKAVVVDLMTKLGEPINADRPPLVETDKMQLEVPSPLAGIVSESPGAPSFAIES